MKYFFILIFFYITITNLFSQKLLIVTDTSKYVFDITTRKISYNDFNLKVDTNKYINFIKNIKNNDSIKVYKINFGETIQGINDTDKNSYFIKYYDTLSYWKTTTYYKLKNDNKNISYVIINKKLNKKLIISTRDGSMKSIDENSFLVWKNNGYYDECMINRNIIYYQFDCRYDNIFIVGNKFIIADKYYSNLGTLFKLKQKYVKIDWETGVKTKLCKNCKAVLLSKNEKYIVFVKENKKYFMVMEIKTNKIIKEFYAKEVYWVN
jgi:hypothetical protein